MIQKKILSKIANNLATLLATLPPPVDVTFLEQDIALRIASPDSSRGLFFIRLEDGFPGLSQTLAKEIELLQYQEDPVFRPHLEHCPKTPILRRKVEAAPAHFPIHMLWRVHQLSHVSHAVSAPWVYSFEILAWVNRQLGVALMLLSFSCFFKSTNWQSDETSTANAGRKKKKEGNIRWRNLLRNLPVSGAVLGYRRYVSLEMRDRCDVTWRRALGRLSCETWDFRGLRLFSSEQFSYIIPQARKMGPFTLDYWP